MTKTYKEGIYFGMPEEEYRNIPCFSRSMAEDMNIDEEEAWNNSAFNPEREIKEPTPAMELGTAIHSMLLEPDVFKELYVKYPTHEDMGDLIILDKNDDLKSFLRDVGEKVTGKKEDLIERASPYINPTSHVIWDNVIKEFNDDVKSNGKRILCNDDLKILQGIKESYDLRPKVKKILQEGQPEITIIWREQFTGIMCKCRLDYARPEAIADVKSFSLRGKQNIDRYINKEIIYQNYNMQYAVYRDALEAVIKKVRSKEAGVFGEVDKEWLERFLQNENKQFFLIFVRTQAPYQIRSVEMKTAFKEGVGATNNLYYTEAVNLWNMAVSKYHNCWQEFGNKRWLNKNEVRVLTDEDVPQVMYQVQL